MARKVSLWTQLSAMSAGIAIPAILLAAFVLFAFARGERSGIEREADFRVLSVAATLDRDLQALITIAELLAGADSTRTGRFEILDRQARSISARMGIFVVLRDLENN